MTTKISMLAIDLAKGGFQVCAVGPDGAVLYNRALSRTRLATLLAAWPACVVAMGLRHVASLGAGGATVRSRSAARAGGLREAFRETPEKRPRRRGSHRGGGVAPDNAFCDGEEPGDPRPRGCVSDAPMPRPAAHAAHQFASGTSGRVRARGAKGPASLKVLENALADETGELPGPVREMGTICLERSRGSPRWSKGWRTSWRRRQGRT